MSTSPPAQYSALITAAELQAWMTSMPAPLLLDCGFDLTQSAAGAAAYAAGHLPGAYYVHLDDVLSGPKMGHPREPEFRGRHPLPDAGRFAAAMRERGWHPARQVVAYDAQGGPYAARAWWLLRALGHRAVAVLDGGVAAWLAAGGVLSTELPALPAQAGPAAAEPAGQGATTAFGQMPQVDATAVQAALGQRPLLDARAPARFRGETEPLDPVAGHIPGALSRFFQDNLLPDGRFKPPAQLRQEFAALGIGLQNAAQVMHQCGSGVTACHNLLAMAHAGLEGSALYPGSWSEWCADARRPVAGSARLAS
jgi:thiosulfate/3-mercaptopyruvate sulfurtransferase